MSRLQGAGLAVFISQVAFGQEPPPAFHAGTRVVEITVAATRAPNKLALRDLVTPPVDDLRATDLRLFDNGVEQTIASFEKLGQGGAPAPTGRDAKDSASPQRLSIIVLDALNTPWTDQIAGRAGVSQMLAKLPPGDRIAILALGDNLHLLHDFSTDYASLRAAVEKYEGEKPANWAGTFPGDLFRAPHPPAAFSERIRIRDTLRALTEIGQMAKIYPGQKSLLWVSIAFPTQFTTLGVGGAAPAPEFFHIEAARAMRELGIANVALYPISPEGLNPLNPDSMTEMAEPTGGRALFGSNDVSALVRAAMDDAREGYVLTFVPKDYQEDGSFHDLSLKTSRKGVELRYRPGYVADRH
jgi:VWFA-related protein